MTLHENDIDIHLYINFYRTFCFTNNKLLIQLCVCVCVCACVCGMCMCYVCMYVCMYVCVWVSVCHVCRCLSVCLCMCAYMYYVYMNILKLKSYYTHNYCRLESNKHFLTLTSKEQMDVKPVKRVCTADHQALITIVRLHLIWLSRSCAIQFIVCLMHLW